MGVLPLPPLPLTIAMVRSPGQCWETLAMSARSVSSAGEGGSDSPIVLATPRKPRVAGALPEIFSSSDSRRRCALSSMRVSCLS